MMNLSKKICSSYLRTWWKPVQKKTWNDKKLIRHDTASLLLLLKCETIMYQGHMGNMFARETTFFKKDICATINFMLRV